MVASACNCGTKWIDEDHGYVAFTDKSSIQLIVQEDTDWAVDTDYEWEDRHYCPKCFVGFDDDDKMIINALPIAADSPQRSEDLERKAGNSAQNI